MTQVFGHKYELYVVQPEELIEVNDATGYEGNSVSLLKNPAILKNKSTVGGAGKGGGGASTGYADYLVISGGALKIAPPIQLDAKVKYKLGGNNTPQTAEIRLYNLSDNSIDRINAGAIVQLNGGYEQNKDLPLVFVGHIISVSTEGNGVERITTILCKEGEIVHKRTNFVKCFSDKVTRRFIIEALMDSFADNGIPRGGLVPHPILEEPVGEAYVAGDLLYKEMTAFCNSINFVWYISKGRLFVQPREGGRFTDFIKLKPQHTIGSILQASKISITSDETQDEIKLTTFLHPEVSFNEYLRIGWGEFEGDYELVEIEHLMNWKDSPWQTNMKAKKAHKYKLGQGR